MGTTLIVIGSIIFLLLGCGHIALTLFTKLLEPQDDSLIALNKQAYSRITKQTTIWKGGIGFHLSHSVGMLVFAMFCLILALENIELLTASLALSTLMLVTPLVYLFLSIKYWFIAPTVGIGFACLCYLVGLGLLAL